MKRLLLQSLLCIGWLTSFAGAAAQTLQDIGREFISGYQQLSIPQFVYDYKAYFAAIPDEVALEKQEAFFQNTEQKLAGLRTTVGSENDRAVYEQLSYEVQNNLERIRLERAWLRAGRHIPANGLYELKERRAWYQLFAKKFTSLALTPEAVDELGRSEVAKVKAVMAAIRQQLGFTDSMAFYAQLQDESFEIRNKEILASGFTRIDSIVRLHLPDFIGTVSIPPVYPVEWPGADAFTPPGMYVGRQDNAYGKDVFLYNFFNGRFNRRAMEWIYLHEAIPGHHLQATLRRETALQQLFLYPGNFEGWGCYVEYSGKELGLYQDIYSYLGKWEWDLVRSARLVLDAGIHYYGWSHEQALAYWNATIPGQQEIAEREVSRVTNWPGQTLSYKAGAACLMQLRKAWQARHPGRPIAEFHQWFMRMGNYPLEVLKINLS